MQLLVLVNLQQRLGGGQQVTRCIVGVRCCDTGSILVDSVTKSGSAVVQVVDVAAKAFHAFGCARKGARKCANGAHSEKKLHFSQNFGNKIRRVIVVHEMVEAGVVWEVGYWLIKVPGRVLARTTL